MLVTRRRVLGLAGTCALTLALPRRVVASTQWTTRRMQAADLPALIDAFEQTRLGGFFAIQAPPWTTDYAMAYYTAHPATVVVERNGVPCVFVGLADWTLPNMGTERPPLCDLFVTRLSLLPSTDHVPAALAAVAAAGREVMRQGFTAARGEPRADMPLAGLLLQYGARLVRRRRLSNEIADVLELEYPATLIDNLTAAGY
jgi:hypothetical protein